MRLRLRPTGTNPIVIDLGWGSAKLLQVSDGRILGADEIQFPSDAGDDVGARLDALRDLLPGAIAASFRGRRVLLAMPSFCTLLQAMQLERSEASDTELAMQMRLPASEDTWMVRPMEVPGPGASCREVICQAMPRSLVLRHVELLHDLKLDVTGVLAQPAPMVAAFDHIHRRADDADACTMHVDLGAGGTTCVLAHGRDIVLARSIPVGGRHFDELIAEAQQCDAATARSRRLSWCSADPRPAEPAPVKANQVAHGSGVMLAMDRRGDGSSESLGPDLNPAVDGDVAGELSPLIESLTDDLHLCLRHHLATWPDIEVSRVIFTGGEARQDWLCRRIVQALHLPGQVGDPLAPLECDAQSSPLVGWSESPRPHWSVAAGLAALAQGGSNRVS